MKLTTLVRFGVICIVALSCQSSQTGNPTSSFDTTISGKPVLDSSVKDTNIIGTSPVKKDNANVFDDSLVTLARTYLQVKYKTEISEKVIDSGSKKFMLFTDDLNSDGKKEIFVGLTGPYFCGSGGCTCFLLNSDGKMISSFTVVQYPIIISETKTNAWKDLIIYSGGKNHLIKYNGSKYPSNPSIQPIYPIKPSENLVRALDNQGKGASWSQF